MAAKPEELIESEVKNIGVLEQSLKDMEAELATNEMFQKFLQMQKVVTTKVAETWKLVEQQMIDHNVKSLKGDWGWITIAERTGFKVDLEQLPPKFVKKVADTKKIGDTYKLTNKLPKGAEVYTTKYLTKGIK